jgi:serine protease AprX
MMTRKTDLRTDDRIASYSSKGPTRIDLVVKPDIVAPGDAITSLAAPGSTLYNARPYRKVGDSYFKMSGTSMAAPMVSGAVALMLEKDPNLTPDQVKARIMKSAYKAFPTRHTYRDMVSGLLFDSQYDIFTIGAGYLDISAALASSELPTLPALSPKIQYNSATDQTAMLYAEGVLWGSGVLWGTGVVWGNGVIWGEAIQWDGGEREINGTAVIWGTGVIWGETTSLARGVIWGAGVIWGESTMAYGNALSSELSDEDGEVID